MLTLVLRCQQTCISVLVLCWICRSTFSASESSETSDEPYTNINKQHFFLLALLLSLLLFFVGYHVVKMKETHRKTSTQRVTKTVLTWDMGCVLFQNLTNLDRSRFVRRDRSSPVKKNTQIFLVVVGVVIWFSSAQSAADHALFYK